MRSPSAQPPASISNRQMVFPTVKPLKGSGRSTSARAKLALTAARAFAGLRKAGDRLTGVRSASEGDRSADLNSSFLCGFAALRECCLFHAKRKRFGDNQAMKIKVSVHDAEEGGY